MEIHWIKADDIDFKIKYKINKSKRLIESDLGDYKENIDLSNLNDGDIIFRQDPLTNFSPLIDAYFIEGELNVYLLCGRNDDDYKGDYEDDIDESNPYIYLTIKTKEEIEYEKNNLSEIREKRMLKKQKIEKSPEEIETLKVENADVWYENFLLKKDLKESKQEVADLWYYVISGSE